MINCRNRSATWEGSESSTTDAEIVQVPAMVGVPESVPSWCRISPGGSGPVAQRYGRRPPLAVSCCEYEEPAAPSGSALVVIASGGPVAMPTSAAAGHSAAEPL